MKTLTLALTTLALTAQANIITIDDLDLGPHGIYFDREIDLPITVPLDGSNHEFSIGFEAGHFIRLGLGSSETFAILLHFHTDTPGSPGFAIGTGYVTDESGDPLQPPQNLVAFTSSDGTTTAGLLPLYSGDLLAPVDFFGVNFNIDLPVQSNRHVTSAHLRMIGGPFGIGDVNVPNPVPDSGSTFGLLGIGFAAMLAWRHRRIRAAILLLPVILLSGCLSGHFERTNADGTSIRLDGIMLNPSKVLKADQPKTPAKP